MGQTKVVDDMKQERGGEWISLKLNKDGSIEVDHPPMPYNPQDLLVFLYEGIGIKLSKNKKYITGLVFNDKIQLRNFYAEFYPQFVDRIMQDVEELEKQVQKTGDYDVVLIRSQALKISKLSKSVR